MPTPLPNLFGVPNVFHWGSGFHLSPDGKTIVFLWNKTGQWQLYTIPIEGGEARQITYASERVASPRWSPDGKMLACLRDYSGDENFDVFLIDPSAGEMRNLTPDTPDEAINWSARWLPDQSGLVYVSNRDGRFATYLISTDGGIRKRLTEHAYSDLVAKPSLDGRWVAVEAMTVGLETGTFLVPLSGGEPIAIGDASSRIDAWGTGWSPDSRQIAFTSDANGGSDVGIFDIASRSIEWLTDGSHECYFSAWSPDGARVAYVENRESDLIIVVHALNGEVKHYSIGPGIHSQPKFTPDGQSLAFIFSGPDCPADLWTLDLTSNQTNQLTNSLPDSIDRSLFVSPIHVYYPSLDEDVQVPALLYLPHGAKRDGTHPAVLFVHGGPTAQHDNDFVIPVQDLAMRGYVVLAPNYRGSTGYGKPWREANRFDMGRGDTNDVVAGADYLVHEGWTDPKRIGITGVSYGGYMTMTGLTFHPDKFAAGSALVPFVNWFTEHANEREDLKYWDRQNMGDPVTHRDRWHAMSPIFFIDRVKAPVQLFAGAHDARCPLDESEQVRDELQKRGRPVELHVYWDEGHGFRKIENRVDAYKKRAAFLDRYVLERGER